MILAADDMRHAEVNVVDHAGEEIEPAAVFAADDGIAEKLRIEALLAADQVVPDDRRIMVQPKAPVRCPAFGYRIIGGTAFVNGR